MRVGTKSVLLGAHQFILHPLFLAVAWWKLYGFPWDPRLWFCFFVHDLGYVGLPNMDGEEGEDHPYRGAFWAGRLLGQGWSAFCALHSRAVARDLNVRPSRLCWADKLALCLEPAWLYLPRVRWTGELDEYLRTASEKGNKHYEWMAAHGAERWAGEREWFAMVKRVYYAQIEEATGWRGT